MEVFKIREDAFKEIQKKMLLRTIATMTISVVLGISISVINTNTDLVGYDYLLYLIPTILLIYGFGAYQVMNKQKKLLQTYTLTIGDNLITREQYDTPSVAIHYFEIKEIIKEKNETFTVRGEKDVISIPKQIDDYAHLENTLGTIQTVIINDSVTAFQKYQGLMGLASAGLILCLYTVNNKVVIGITGILFIALMFWSFIQSRRNYNGDSKTKRSIWYTLLALVFVINLMAHKLTGFSLGNLLAYLQ
jgi:hypothetical protein